MDGLAHIHQINNSIDETKESENSIRINNFRKEKGSGMCLSLKDVMKGLKKNDDK